jgi:hypothetical protein
MLTGRLCSLAESQLQMQTARSSALDGGALGVIAVDAGVAAIIVGAPGAYGLWIVALVLLGLSLGVAVRTLRLPGAEDTGPSVAEIHDARDTQSDLRLEDLLFKGLASEGENNPHLAVCRLPLQFPAKQPTGLRNDPPPRSGLGRYGVPGCAA